MEGLRLSKEELKRRFALSERLAVRIGALQAKGLRLTAAVLEEAARDREIEALLLSPSLLKKPDAARLRKGGLAIFDGVLAFEEEALAEKGFASEEKKELSVLHRDETEKLFTNEDLSQLKLTLLTEVDARGKIQALRKLGLSPIPAEEKGALTIRALADPDAEVRREAASMLRTLGLPQDLSEALAALSEPSPRGKILAIQKLSTRPSKPAERSIILACLVSCLKFETEAEVLVAIVEGLVPFADILADEPLAAVGRQIVKLLADRFAALSAPAAKLLAALSATRRPAVSEALWREIEGVQDRAIRTYFETALASMDHAPAFRASLAKVVARDLAALPYDEMPTRRLVEASKSLGDDMVRSLLEVYPTVSADLRGSFLATLDAVATTDFVSASARDAAGRLFVDALSTASRSLRIFLLESRLASDPRLGAAVKRDLCLDFLGNLHAFRAERILDLTIAALRRMGPDISEALKDRVMKSTYAEERKAAATALAELGQISGDADELIRFFRGIEKSDRIPAGTVARYVGRITANPRASRGVLAEIARDYLKALPGSQHWFDLVAALGWIGASPACDPGVACDILLRLLDLLESDLPTPEVREEKTEDGTRIDVGAQTLVYTDLLPDVIGGISRIACSGRVPAGILERTIRRLADKFRSVAEYREVWAPGNLVELARAMAEIAKRPETTSESRTAIIESLMGNVQNLSTARIVSEVLAVEDKSKRHQTLAGECARKLFSLLSREDYREREDRRAIVAALGRIALNKGFGGSKEEDAALRGRALEALLEEFRSDFAEGRGVLERLAGCATLPKEYRARIRTVIGGA